MDVSWTSLSFFVQQFFALMSRHATQGMIITMVELKQSDFVHLAPGILVQSCSRMARFGQFLNWDDFMGVSIVGVPQARWMGL